MTLKKQLLEIISIQTEIAKLGLDLAGVMSLVVERTLDLVDADGAAIELADGEDMLYQDTSGSAEPFLGLRISREHSLSGLCVNSGEALNCRDSEHDRRVDIQACRKIGLRSMVVVPLKHENKTVGVLKAISRKVNQFTDDSLHTLQLLSELIGASMFFAAKYNSEDIFHRATHDSMTDLANHGLFMDRLRNILTQASRENKNVAVLMIDMNGLKFINDTYGHQVGDEAIKVLAYRIKSIARSSDTVARLGGDEFGVILNPVDSSGSVEKVINRINEIIGNSFNFKGETYSLSASIGSALFPDDAQDMYTLIDVADKKMYAAKYLKRL